jgi:hypothetical protein
MKNKKTLILVALMVSAVIDGIAHQLVSPNQPFAQVDIVFMFAGVILVFAWYRLDSNQHGYKRSPFLNVAVVAIAALALPYYFFQSRGFRGGLVETALFVGSAVLYSVLQYAGIYAVYFASKS